MALSWRQVVQMVPSRLICLARLFHKTAVFRYNSLYHELHPA
ncbi:MAG: hypothetical protein AAF614_07870 [Chloroflexota bacterium]